MSKAQTGVPTRTQSVQSQETKMARLTELGYMGIGVKNPDEWKEFAG